MAKKESGKPARVCSWDCDSNPTFNLFTPQNLEEVVPGVAYPLIATWWPENDYMGMRELFKRMGVLEYIPLYEPPVGNYIPVYAGRFALNLMMFAAAGGVFSPDGGVALVRQFLTAEAGDVKPVITDGRVRDRLARRFYRHSLPSTYARIGHNNRRCDAFRAELMRADLRAESDVALSARVRVMRRMSAHMYASHLLISVGAGLYAANTGIYLAGELSPDFSEAMVAGLNAGLGEVESARPGFELWKLGRFVASKPALAGGFAKMSAPEIRRAVEQPLDDDWTAFAKRFRGFIEEFWYRGQSEADASKPAWDEDPTFVLSIIKANATAAADVDPVRHAAKAVKSREALERDILAKLWPGARAEFRRLARLSQQYARARERTKASLVRSHRLYRPILLEMARRGVERGLIDRPDDFWFLLWSEVEEILSGQSAADYRPQVAARRAEMARMEKVMPPDAFLAPPEVTPITTIRATEDSLAGVGVSAGIATGRARVVRSAAAAEESHLEPGEVLVAPFTDAAWTPLFVPAVAVVVETGGALSHAATVAREYGIPAVVAVKGATSRIRDGQLITVDGLTGTVTVAV